MVQPTNREFYLFCIELEKKLSEQTSQEILVCPYQSELFWEGSYKPHHSWEFAQIMLTDYGEVAVYTRNPVKLWGTPLASLIAIAAKITAAVLFSCSDPKATSIGCLGVGAMLSAIVLSRR
ncbi:MAG: hypothetical protein F6K41_13655 [Symploca sp. SIO3E6]|nr:hypothetical protein [Caldora sp. SIO3E6]